MTASPSVVGTFASAASGLLATRELRAPAVAAIQPSTTALPAPVPVAWPSHASAPGEGSPPPCTATAMAVPLQVVSSPAPREVPPSCVDGAFHPPALSLLGEGVLPALSNVAPLPAATSVAARLPRRTTQAPSSMVLGLQAPDALPRGGIPAPHADPPGGSSQVSSSSGLNVASVA